MTAGVYAVGPGCTLTLDLSRGSIDCLSFVLGRGPRLSNGATGCCSDTLFLGTVYLPGQQISSSTNQAMGTPAW